jgi:biotin synthase-like enzyme
VEAVRSAPSRPIKRVYDRSLRRVNLNQEEEFPDFDEVRTKMPKKERIDTQQKALRVVQ